MIVQKDADFITYVADDAFRINRQKRLARRWQDIFVMQIAVKEMCVVKRNLILGKIRVFYFEIQKENLFFQLL